MGFKSLKPFNCRYDIHGPSQGDSYSLVETGRGERDRREGGVEQGSRREREGCRKGGERRRKGAVDSEREREGGSVGPGMREQPKEEEEDGEG